MARKSRSGDGEYDVGYRKPPREHQFNRENLATTEGVRAQRRPATMNHH